MNIIDLTGPYIKYIINSYNPVHYLGSYPAFFDHYFKYWAEKGSYIQKLSHKVLLERKELVLTELCGIIEQLTANGFDIDKIDVVIFVGTDTSNGHAFKNEHKLIVWLPLESYSSSLRAKVFLTHEFIHAVHYTYSPEYYFENITQRNNTLRQLVTEGIAVLVTKYILNINEEIALWADYIPEVNIKNWMDACRLNEEAIFSVLYESIKSESQTYLFDASDPDDILNYRAGYYAALKLVNMAMKELNYDYKELLSVKQDIFKKLFLEYLQKKCVG